MAIRRIREEDGITIRIDQLAILFASVEAKTPDGKYLLLGANTETSETPKEAEIELWLCQKSCINNDAEGDPEDVVSPDGVVAYVTFNIMAIANATDPEAALKSGIPEKFWPYMAELKKATHHMLQVMKEEFEFEDEQMDDREYEEIDLSIEALPNGNGTFDITISEENATGYNYHNLSADEVGKKVAKYLAETTPAIGLNFEAFE